MNRKRTEIIAGLFTLAGILVIAYLAIGIGGQRMGSNTYALKARFSNVGGLSSGGSVRIAGVSVGEVVGVEIDPKTYFATVEFRIPDDLKLSEDTYASIKTNGMIGEKFLSLNPGGLDENLQPGDLIVDTESALDLEGLISKFAFGNVENEGESNDESN